MPTAVIAGASRGIGAALARSLAAGGWTVLGTSRSGQLPAAPGAGGGALYAHPLEITDPDSIATLAEALGAEAVDALVIAAGTLDRRGGLGGGGAPVPEAEVMATNVEGPLALTEALMPNLAAAAPGRLVLISSAEGIRTGRQRPMGAYGRSKAALNDTVRARAQDWARQGVIGIALHPGWVRTDMGGPGGMISAEESAAGIHRVIEGLRPEHCGAFLDFRGRSLPW